MSLNIVVMSNLLNKLTTSPRAGRYSPIFEIFNDFDRILTPESFSNDNIRFNESKESFHVEIDLPGVKKKILRSHTMRIQTLHMLKLSVLLLLKLVQKKKHIQGHSD